MVKRKAVIFALLVLLFSLAVQFVAAQGLTATVTNNLNLRATPSTRGTRLLTMPAGTVVMLDGRDARGQWVRGVTPAGQAGWMLARYLNVGPGQIATLPIVDASAPVATTASSAPAAPAGGMVVTAATGVNLRGGPGTNFPKVGFVRAGESFAVDGRDTSGNWLHGVNASGQTGWVAARYMRGANIASLPVISGNPPATTSAPTAPSAPSAPPPVVNAPPVTGFDYGGHVLGLGDRTLNAMRTARMSWVKFQVRYSQGQDPNAVAGTIGDGHGKGFRVLLSVVGHKDQINNGNYFNDFANYLAGLARLGADAIEVWNETNIDREWPAGQINPGMYTQMLAAAYNAIKGANPNTLVISAAPAPTGFYGGCHGGGCDDAPYLAGMAAAGAANYMDCIGAHYNEGIVPPTQTSGDPRGEYFTRYYPSMVSTYYNAFGGRRKICFTELGYLTPEGYPPLPPAFAWGQNTTVAQQAAWLDQAVSMAASGGQVRLLIVWNVDFTEYGADPMAGFAIIRPDGSCPACVALGS